ncbi:hypothetical protein [Endozoicomonas acroporae]
MEALLFSHDRKLFLAMRGGPYMTLIFFDPDFSDFSDFSDF